MCIRDRWFVRVEMQAQNNKLTRLGDRKSLPIDWLQDEGSYAIAFLVNARDPHLSKAGPCRRLFLNREASISRGCRARFLLEHGLKRRLPTWAKCGNP